MSQIDDLLAGAKDTITVKRVTAIRINPTGLR